jgi:hypothetical protein
MQSKLSSRLIGANLRLNMGSNRQLLSRDIGYIPLDIEINMEFSKEVIKRARILIGRYAVMGVDLRGTSAIVHLDAALDTIEDMRQFAPLKVKKAVRRAAEIEQLLNSLEIFDDRSALAYMDEIEPKYDLYLEAYDRIVARHNQEKEELLASFMT